VRPLLEFFTCWKLRHMITYIPAHYGIAADRDKDTSTQHGLLLDRDRRVRRCGVFYMEVQ
jgi:hypothetical protein